MPTLPSPIETPIASSPRSGAVDAALVCIARHGLGKLTVDDVAREAGCGRATLYREFGSKRALVTSVVATEADRVVAAVRAAAAAEDTLDDVVVAILTTLGAEADGHAALQFVAAFEPGLLVPHLTFGGADRFLARGRGRARSVLRTLRRPPPTRCAPRSGSHASRSCSGARRPRPRRRSCSPSPTPFAPSSDSSSYRGSDPAYPPGGSHMASTNEQMIGRADVDDVNAILAVTNTDVDEVAHAVRAEADAIFTWDYEQSRKALHKLYEKAKTSQWNANDLPWETEVDQEAVAVANRALNGFTDEMDLRGTPFEKWGDKEWIEFGVQSQNWTLSQFMHGEQGALICTAQIVETVPWIDAKYYASTQVMDEARHVEVFARYLDTKLSGHYPINAHLKMLLDDIIADSRWDMTYLGMQVMVEGLALAAFGFMHQMTTEPLIKQLLRYVMSDEARHVAFGVLSLQEYYQQLSAAEIRERQEFAFEAAVRMRDRFLQQEVWERMGVDVKEAVKVVFNAPDRPIFQGLLFSKIVPNCKKLGLLDAADGWLRQRFTELGVIQYEDWVDTGEEYTTLDEVAKDREQAVA